MSVVEMGNYRGFRMVSTCFELFRHKVRQVELEYPSGLVLRSSVMGGCSMV